MRWVPGGEFGEVVAEHSGSTYKVSSDCGGYALVIDGQLHSIAYSMVDQLNNAEAIASGKDGNE